MSEQGLKADAALKQRDVGFERDSQWLELRGSIEARVRLEPSHLVLGERELVWYRVANPDDLLEAAVADTGQAAEEVDPFWAATWRAAIGLDRFLRTLDVGGKRVLELGCGSGQAGVGAAIRGAQVTMTDAVELAMSVAQLNGWLVRDRIDWRKLRWGVDKLDGPRFPLIIGSDLVYDPNLFEALERCAREHLDEGGQLLLSEPHRHTGDRFSTWILEKGWHTREHDVDLQDQRVPIRIFECRLQPFL